MFGSGRAMLSLRDDYRHDLREVKRITGFEYVRFHGILHDEVGVYDEDAQRPTASTISPTSTRSTTACSRTASDPSSSSASCRRSWPRDPDALHAFWYKPNVAPPKDWDKWDAMIGAFTKHLVDRYGIDEVSQWYFEVWNEPNIDFWAGKPKQTKRTSSSTTTPRSA